MEEIKDIAQWEENDSELAKYKIHGLNLLVCSLKKQIKNNEEQLKELQQIIDKAKKYLKKQSGWNRISCYGIDGEDVFELLDILRGKDEN